MNKLIRREGSEIGKIKNGMQREKEEVEKRERKRTGE
jgi:hypothetical protein